MFAKSVHVSRAVLGAMSLFLFVACGSDDTPAPAAEPAATPTKPAAPAAKVPSPHIPNNVTVEARDSDGNPIRFSGTDGQGNAFEASIGDNAKIPSSFPSDVPVYPGAEPMAAMAAAGEGTMVTFKTTESQQDIYEFYQSKLDEQGWKIGEQESFGGQLGLEAVKESRKVTVNISGTNGDTRFSVVVVDAS